MGTLLNLAACHEREGKLAHAWDEYHKALAIARTENQPDRARIAEQRIALLEPRVPWLRVTAAAGASELTVSLDGLELESVMLGTQVPVDPGVHVVMAQANGSVVFEECVELREGERRNVTVATPRESSAPESTAPAARTAQAVVAPPRRWVLELGLFAGGAYGEATEPKGSSPDASGARFPDGRGNEVECVDIGGCVFAPTRGGAFVGGFNAFAGYALRQWLDAGLRAVVGMNDHYRPLVGLGPELVFRITSWFGVGVWGVVGTTSIRGEATVSPANNRNLFVFADGYQDGVRGIIGTFGEAYGAGLDINFPVRAAGPGQIVLNTTPFIMYGPTGHALAVPVGVAYRFD